MRRDFFTTREGLACHREIRRRLGQALRATYEETLAQGVPDHLAELLQRLDERERQGEGRPPSRSAR